MKTQPKFARRSVAKPRTIRIDGPRFVLEVSEVGDGLVDYRVAASARELCAAWALYCECKAAGRAQAAR